MSNFCGGHQKFMKVQEVRTNKILLSKSVSPIWHYRSAGSGLLLRRWETPLDEVPSHRRYYLNLRLFFQFFELFNAHLIKIFEGASRNLFLYNFYFFFSWGKVLLLMFRIWCLLVFQHEAMLFGDHFCRWVVDSKVFSGLN